jgi:hypothetical protein
MIKVLMYGLAWATPVLLAVKAFGLVSLSWWVVFAPWLFMLFLVTVAIVLGATVFKDDD